MVVWENNTTFSSIKTESKIRKKIRLDMKVFHVQIFADILDKERNNLYHNKESKITDMTVF